MSVHAEILSRVRIGQPRHFEGLTQYPLFDPEADGNPPDYAVLEDALEAKQVEIREVSEGGQVSALLLDNRGDRPVLLLDGEELIGAKQNRILNVTVLAPPGETRLPVSCVEAGRWQYRERAFRSARRTQFAEGRAAKLAVVNEYSLADDYMPGEADQAAVWADIDAKAARLNVRSRTNAMADMFDHYESDIEDYVAALEPAPGQTGVLFALNGHVRGLDLFDHADTLAHNLPKLVRSHALDAIERRHAGQTRGFADVWGFLDRLAEARPRIVASPGLGEDIRLSGQGVEGAGLIWEDRLVHLVAFEQIRRNRPVRRGPRIRR